MAIYLDHAAATPVDRSVMAAMQPFFSEQFYNPSSLYAPAVAASGALKEARATIAGLLGAKPAEIIFTAGGTEANNLAVHGVMRDYPEASLAISAIEHDSVRRPAANYPVHTVGVDAQGLADVASVARAVTDSTVLVSIMYANNEVGTVQPIRRIARELARIRAERLATGNPLPLYFHIDAAQAGNHLDLHVHRLGVDMMTINGGKLYGPKQSGALFVKSGLVLRPLIEGGGQERNLRSGTENIAGAVGLAKALQICVEKRPGESARLQQLQHNAIHLLKEVFPEAIINGSLRHRLPNNLHITLPGADNERLLMALDMRDIYAAAGSACSASHDEPSPVLAAMGLSAAHIRSSIRFSMGRLTDTDDMAKAITALQEILA